jgi:hypothetical protein
MADEVTGAEDLPESGESCDYTTRELRGILDCSRDDNNFICDVLFRDVIEFESEEIIWDRVGYDDIDMAPMVCPCVQAPLVGATQNFDRMTFSPAYSKFKSIFNACRPLQFEPGERCWGEFTLLERRDLWMARTLRQHDRMLNKREEFMAIEALKHGRVTVEGPLYPKVEIDLKREANLDGAAKTKWSKDSCQAMDDLQEWADEVSCTAEGSPSINVWLMNSKTCRKLKSDQQLLECLKSAGRTDLIQQTGFDLTPRARKINGARLDFTIGQFQIWCVDTFYWVKDSKGNRHKKFFFDDGEVVGLAAGNEDCDARPIKLYGAIMDCDVLAAQRRYTKMWKINDPSAEVIMTQSAPLPVLLNPNATIRRTGLC